MSQNSKKSKTRSVDQVNTKAVNDARLAQMKCKTKPPPTRPNPGSVGGSSSTNSKSLKNTKAMSKRSVGIRKPGSISSMASQYSLATNRFIPYTTNSDIVSQAVGNQQFSQYGQDSLYDCVMIYLHCPIA